MFLLVRVVVVVVVVVVGVVVIAVNSRIDNDEANNTRAKRS